jgi:hypothetical protein
MPTDTITTTQGFVLPADESNNAPWGRAINLLANAFKALDTLLNSVQVLAKAAVQSAQIQQSSLIYAADTGTADHYAVSLTPAPTLTAGSVILFKALHSNTGQNNSTLSVNGGTPKQIICQGGAPTGADINAGQILMLVYDGTAFQMIGNYQA